MNCIVRFLKNEFTGWQVWEFIYVAAAAIAIGVIAMILGDTPLGIASAVAGTLYTMFAGKGKISCYIFGIFNTITYGYISYTRQIYGDMCLNWAIYLPMMFAGIILWNRRRDEQHTVIKTMLSFRSRITLILINIAAIAAFAAVLHKMGGGQPVIDSCTTVLSITAMLLTLKRCIEQWLLWTAVNLLSVIMWVRVFVSTGGGSAATLLWWLIMLITGIIFYIQWLRPGRPR
ncbi:MAG: nicotinamide mononucleotide transporter [Lentisphaerae bacterium]|nr:nicotinamide mononucleotide transporter [Lentisphaerota bacterium]